MSLRKRLRTRRGGGGWDDGWGRLVLCVALVLCTLSPTCQGDASVPTPLHPTPAPTSVMICPQMTYPFKEVPPTVYHLFGLKRPSPPYTFDNYFPTKRQTWTLLPLVLGAHL